MTISAEVHEVARQAETGEMSPAILDIGIPPRPGIVAELQKEMAADDPDLKRLGRLIGHDVALTAALLKLANAPFYALTRRVESVDQAISMLGLRQVSILVTNVTLRNAVRGNPSDLSRFWDTSAKRAYALATLARSLKGTEIDVAQSFGLFCDIGIPLLMNRFDGYKDAVKAADQDGSRSFSDIEREAKYPDHALIGSMMARTWGMSQEASAAIRAHHDFASAQEAGSSGQVSRLIAMNLIAELAIRRFAGIDGCPEWAVAGDRALGTLALSDVDLEDWLVDLTEGFATAPGL